MAKYIVFFILLIPVLSLAQESPFKPLNAGTYHVNYQSLDSQANAIVMEEYGKSRIEVIEADRGVRLIHDYHVRIKIINQEGFGKANFTLPLYKIGDSFEYIQDLNGLTYNLENGKLVTKELTKKQIFNEKYSERVQLSKFTFPDIKEGSVIELHYRLISPDLFNYRQWQFQDDIPKLHSQYIAEIPGNYTYNVTLVGPYKLTDQKSKLLKECFLFNGMRTDCSQLTYVLKDIPAFVEEDYMLAPKNYLSAIQFELVSFQDGRGGNYKYTKEWKDVDRELLTDKEFGGQLKKTDEFKDILPTLIKPEDTQLAKAKAVYNYVKNQLKWNNMYGFYSRAGVEESLKSRSGSIGDINLTLATGLLAAGIETYPVLLSTRQNGLPNSLHPVISDFNYVIALAIIDGEQYLLDASEKYLPFGELPLRAINHNGRVVYSKKSSDWLPMVNTTVSKTINAFNGQLNLDGNLTGQLNFEYAGLDALNKRNEIKKYASDEEYLEFLQERMTNMTINKMELINVDDLDKLLSVKLEITYNLFTDSIGNSKEINLNPLFVNRTTKNPFNLDERNYPVDLGSQKEESHIVIIKMPKEYSLKDKPKDVSMALPEKAARYVYQSSFTANVLSVKQNIYLNKNIYNVDEYFHLKEFFSRIIQQQKLEFSFTKNNE
ncbi:DUF3857 domain-containing protein [Sphingobacterium hungaricum]|uniref:DUF3857 domain-containing protein n=1 Tax=Sphingobacterium hungaricum TaxID=2082723 RepID=A0A928UWM3_9SPHI|nr:DUF3857 domain-containing protein [Sphingobacterium hungaricum]MBE8712464.1 hypothetical protein [Sphingobacterium hungaricum]